MKKGKKSAGEIFREKSEMQLIMEVAKTEKRKPRYPTPRGIIYDLI